MTLRGSVVQRLTWSSVAGAILFLSAVCVMAEAPDLRLVDAAAAQNWSAVRELLRLRAAVNASRADRTTPLIWAASAALAGLPKGDGSVLDSSLFLYGASISDSNTHFHEDLPIALVAGKATGIKGNRYVRYPKGTPIANLYLTLLETLGVHIDKFGDATGTLQSISDKTRSAL